MITRSAQFPGLGALAFTHPGRLFRRSPMATHLRPGKPPAPRRTYPRSKTRTNAVAVARASQANRDTLTVSVIDNEDFTTFFLELLNAGYLAWLADDDRARRISRRELSLPLHSSLSWREWKSLLIPVVKRWWADFTG